MHGVHFGKNLANFIGTILNTSNINTKQNSANTVPVGQAEETGNVTNIDDVLAQDPRAIYGKALTLGNTQTNPVKLGDKLDSYVPELTNMFNARQGQSLAEDIAKFTPEERLNVTMAFQTAQMQEAMRRIAETPDDVQARIGQDFMANFA